MNIGVWLLVAALGAIVGTIINALVRHLEMPFILNLCVGMLGALIGTALFQITGTQILGPLTPYIAAMVFALTLSAGAVLSYSLTFANKKSR